MAQYEADKIIQLLQFCSWKAQTEMTHTGLHELNAKLGSLPDSDDQTPNEKYLVDLLSDARTAIKKDNIITKRKAYIDLLLRFARFTSWHDWKDQLYKAIEYVQPDSFTPIETQQLSLTIWTPGMLNKKFAQPLESIRESIFPKLRIIRCQNDNLSEALQHLLSQVEEHTLVIATFPIEWKHIPSDLKENEWKVLIQSGKIIPIWIESHDIWETVPPFIPGIKPNAVISGMTGALTTLLFIGSAIMGNSAELLDGEATKTTPSGNSQHFHNPSGGIYLQGDIHNLHNGNGSQIINNYLD